MLLKNTMKFKVLSFVFLCFVSLTMSAQLRDSLELPDGFVVNDSLTTNEKIQEEDKGYGIFSMFSGNPGKAALYSMILPGAGQAFNKRWWKVPIAIAAEASVIYLLQENISFFKLWDDEWKGMVRGDGPTFNHRLSTSGVEDRRNRARQNKDYTWVALIGVHLIIAADAFVDRHLIEFDVNDDLSFDINPISPVPGINVVVTF